MYIYISIQFEVMSWVRYNLYILVFMPLHNEKLHCVHNSPCTLPFLLFIFPKFCDKTSQPHRMTDVLEKVEKSMEEGQRCCSQS